MSFDLYPIDIKPSSLSGTTVQHILGMSHLFKVLPMPKNPFTTMDTPELTVEELAYYGYKRHFRGISAQDALLERTPETISSLPIQREVQVKIHQNALENVYQVASELLSSNVFASASEARRRFPGMFTLSQPLDHIRERLESESAEEAIRTLQGFVGPSLSEFMYRAQIGKCNHLVSAIVEYGV